MNRQFLFHYYYIIRKPRDKTIIIRVLSDSIQEPSLAHSLSVIQQSLDWLLVLVDLTIRDNPFIYLNTNYSHYCTDAGIIERQVGNLQ